MMDWSRWWQQVLREKVGKEAKLGRDRGWERGRSILAVASHERRDGKERKVGKERRTMKGRWEPGSQ